MFRLQLAVKLCFVICIVFVLPTGLLSSAYAIQAGANGADGVDGDPGTAGGDGEDGMDVEGDPAFGQTFAFGNAGGNGGKGGNGVDGDDADSSAAGGKGGTGGKGGNAMAENSRRVFVRGGNGGSGGLFGRGTERPLNGLGGNGGLGGDAFAYTSAPISGSRAQAVGGRGGNAYGPNAFAGNGGRAFVQATTTAAPPYSNDLTAIKFGGSGGTGYITATGGMGASIDYGVDDEFDYGTGSGTIFLSGRAGSGGDSENGIAGTAGNSTLNMAGIKQQLWDTTNGFTLTRFELFGGYGGRGIATGTQNSSGAAGGQAALMGETTFDSEFWSQFTVDLRGGNGGSALGSRNSGAGGHGGVASVDPINVNATESGINTSSEIRATVTGGDGGHANGTGRAGNGASVDLANKFSISTGNNARMSLTANGGNGGWGKNNGHGGNAVVATEYSVTQTEQSNRQNVIEVQANGGNAGLGVVPQIASTGGDAFASSIEETTNWLSVNAHAVGGIGNFGKSGDSFARAQATTTGVDLDRYRAFADASAKAQLLSNFDRVLPSIGTNSTSEAKATSNSASDAIARSRAVGGWGFLESGSANSMAHAENLVTGNATSYSSSFATSDRDEETENFSTSHASSKSMQGRAASTSVADSLGHFNRNLATAGIDAKQGSAYSRTSSSTLNWEHNAVITNNIDFMSSGGDSALVDSSSYFGFRQTGFADTTGVESSVNLLLIPDRTFADTVIASSGITDVFDEDADVLGLGSMGGGFAGDSFEGELAIDSAIDMSLRLQPDQDSRSLILGLFGVESTGDGFADLSFSVTFMGQSLFDETFTDLADATNFFDDHLFNLGELNNEETLIDFQFDFSMNVNDPLDSFAFDFAFANADPRMGNGPQALVLGGGNGGLSAVPEPASGVALGLTMLVLVSRRRRTGLSGRY